jgi:hypothetical protein
LEALSPRLQPPAKTAGLAEQETKYAQIAAVATAPDLISAPIPQPTGSPSLTAAPAANDGDVTSPSKRKKTFPVKPPRPSETSLGGVSWQPRNHKWQVIVEVEGKIVGLGEYESEIEATKAYNAHVGRSSSSSSRSSTVSVGLVNDSASGSAAAEAPAAPPASIAAAAGTDLLIAPVSSTSSNSIEGASDLVSAVNSNSNTSSNNEMSNSSNNDNSSSSSSSIPAHHGASTNERAHEKEGANAQPLADPNMQSLSSQSAAAVVAGDESVNEASKAMAMDEDGAKGGLETIGIAASGGGGGGGAVTEDEILHQSAIGDASRTPTSALQIPAATTTPAPPTTTETTTVTTPAAATPIASPSKTPATIAAPTFVVPQVPRDNNMSITSNSHPSGGSYDANSASSNSLISSPTSTTATATNAISSNLGCLPSPPSHITAVPPPTIPSPSAGTGVATAHTAPAPAPADSAAAVTSSSAVQHGGVAVDDLSVLDKEALVAQELAARKQEEKRKKAAAYRAKKKLEKQQEMLAAAAAAAAAGLTDNGGALESLTVTLRI